MKTLKIPPAGMAAKLMIYIQAGYPLKDEILSLQASDFAAVAVTKLVPESKKQGKSSPYVLAKPRFDKNTGLEASFTVGKPIRILPAVVASLYEGIAVGPFLN